MAVTVKEPKRISVNTLKEVLGDKRAIALIAEVRQKETMHRFASISKVEADATLEFMAGEVTPANANVAGRVLRRYALLGSPRVKNSIRGWLSMQTNPNGEGPRRQPDSPEVAERKRAALVKARAALARKQGKRGK